MSIEIRGTKVSRQTHCLLRWFLQKFQRPSSTSIAFELYDWQYNSRNEQRSPFEKPFMNSGVTLCVYCFFFSIIRYEFSYPFIALSFEILNFSLNERHLDNTQDVLVYPRGTLSKFICFINKKLLPQVFATTLEPLWE